MTNPYVIPPRMVAHIKDDVSVLPIDPKGRVAITRIVDSEAQVVDLVASLAAIDAALESVVATNPAGFIVTLLVPVHADHEPF